MNLVPDQEAGGEQLAGDQGQHQRQEGVEQDGAVERLRIVFGVARALASDGENGSLERRRRGDVGKEESSVNVEHFNVVVNSGSVGLGVVLEAVAVVGGGRVDHFNRRKRYGTRKNLDKFQKPI